MSIARDLFQLQETELALETNEQTQTRINVQLNDNQTVLKAKTTLDASQKNLNDLTKQQKQNDWDIDDLTTKIKTIDKKLYGGKIGNPKELSNLQTEAEDFKKKLSGFEDTSLGLMDKIESARQTLNVATSELGLVETLRQTQQKQFAEELVQLKANHTTLDTKKQELTTQIDASTMEMYRHLRKSRGMAVSRVEKGICTGCRITLPNADLQNAKSNNLARCSSCGRILFL